jgi:hypothetical protein
MARLTKAKSEIKWWYGKIHHRDLTLKEAINC